MRLYFRPKMTGSMDDSYVTASGFAFYSTYVVDNLGNVVATQEKGQWWRVASHGSPPFGPYNFLELSAA